MSSEFLLRARKFSESVLVSETHQTLDEKKKRYGKTKNIRLISGKHKAQINSFGI